MSLAAELPIDGVTVWMTDRSSDALDVRASAAGIGRAAANVRIVHGDWFDALPSELSGTVALVVSNPPYVEDDDPDLESIVREWEPTDALFAGADGLDAIRRIISDAPRWLRPGGWLVVEIGSAQGQQENQLLRASGYDDVEITADLTGRDRWPADVGCRLARRTRPPLGPSLSCLRARLRNCDVQSRARAPRPGAISDAVRPLSRPGRDHTDLARPICVAAFVQV